MKNRKVPAKMINKNIIILGSKGMLGNQVLNYFKKKKYLIKTFDKRFKKFENVKLVKIIKNR